MDAARRGSITDLTELANFWQEMPDLITRGVLDVFFAHLDESMVPSNQGPTAPQSAQASRAFMALLGVSKSGNFSPDRTSHLTSIIRALPGMFRDHSALKHG